MHSLSDLRVMFSSLSEADKLALIMESRFERRQAHAPKPKAVKTKTPKKPKSTNINKKLEAALLADPETLQKLIEALQ